MNISILEPNLIQNAGHYSDWPKQIAQYLAVELKHKVTIYAHNTVKKSVFDDLSEIAEVKPYFSSKLNLGLDYDTINPKIIRSQYDLLSTELNNIEPSDLWIIPTLSSIFLLALIRSHPTNAISSVTHLIPHFNGKNGIKLWKLCGERLQNSNLNINFFVTVPELIPLYNKLLQQTIQHIPYLYNSLDHKMIEKKSLLNTVGFLGHQRPEKGLRLLPHLTHFISKMGLKIILQDSSGRIEVKDSNNILLVKYVDDLPKIITQCDLIIAPYNPLRYRFRMSAMIIDALANAIPVVAPSNTSSGNLVEKFHAGETFDQFDVESILSAIKKVQSNYEEYAHGAFEASKYLHENHGNEIFIRKLILKEN